MSSLYHLNQKLADLRRRVADLKRVEPSAVTTASLSALERQITDLETKIAQERDKGG